MTEENALKAGDKMKDGTIFAGISPDTGEKMYAAPNDAPLTMEFIAVAQYAKNLEVGGKKDFRVPSKAELKVLFDNREKGALKGTFNLTGSRPCDYYWSSTRWDYGAWGQRFSDGAQDSFCGIYDLSVRCVR
ncbi:MAG: DUF1566 domain-containing protein [Alphaproteobacteria bacterium]|nr:DUF1566 domain-containing protein [Alphaproteobacteria bacterium]